MEFLVEYTRKKRVIRSSPAMFITSLYQSFKFEDTVWCVEMWNEDWGTWVQFNEDNVPSRPRVRVEQSNILDDAIG